ncbi:UNVERIFIED_CONTAM: armc8 [Trichonephila clavipes]
MSIRSADFVNERENLYWRKPVQCQAMQLVHAYFGELKLTKVMMKMHSNVKLQIAATFCISNLLWKEEDGSLERQIKLKELGVLQLLQQLLSTSDTTLFERFISSLVT